MIGISGYFKTIAHNVVKHALSLIFMNYTVYINLNSWIKKDNNYIFFLWRDVMIFFQFILIKYCNKPENNWIRIR